MWDARSFVHFLRASIALAAGEIRGARRFADLAHEARAYGSPPPHFAAAVEALSAHISVFEPSGGPATGLRGLTDALHMAVTAGCAETCDTWRADSPRPAVEQSQVTAARERVRAELGDRRYESEHTAGSALTTDEAVALLTGIVAGLTSS